LLHIEGRQTCSRGRETRVRPWILAERTAQHAKQTQTHSHTNTEQHASKCTHVSQDSEATVALNYCVSSAVLLQLACMHCPSCGVATHAAFHVWFWSPQRAFREIPSTQYISCESLCVDQKPPFPFVSFTRRFDCPERVVIKSSSFLLWNVDGKKKRATTLLALTCHGVTAADSGQSSGTGSPCGKRLSCFSVSLCLSRARLGKLIGFIWR
jgi:hypothetical protein